MDKKKFFEAVNLIDDDLIKEAEISPAKLVKADTMGEEDGISISGVEVYSNKIKWRRIAATAAMFILVAGVGAVGYNVFKHRVPVVKEDIELVTKANSTDDVSTSESNDKNVAESETTSGQKSEKASEKTTEKVTSAAKEKKDTEQTSKTDKNDQTTEAVVQVTIQQTEKPYETQKPKTTSKTTSKMTTKAMTKATTTKSTETTTKTSDTCEVIDVFARLNDLTYSPDTCDGLPEYVLNAPGDTEIFYFNFSSKWVWRNSSASNPVQKEAVLPDELADYLMSHGDEIGMYPAQYSVTPPLQNYDFNAQYIRTNNHGGGGSYPQKKLITSRSELDSYIESIKDSYYIDGEFLGHDSLIDAIEKYDASWFSNHKLLVVVLEEGSGSNRHRVAQVGGICVTIERLLPQIGTCDMAQWHILIEVDKDVYVNSDFMVSTYDTHVQDNWLE